MRVLREPALRVRDADQVEHLQRPLLGDVLGHLVVHLVRLHDLVADRVQRVQRGLRVLEHHRHRVAADLHQLALRQADDLVAAEPDRAGDLGPLPVVQAHHGHAGDRFAGAGLTDDRQRPAERDRVTQSVHRADHTVGGRKLDGEVLDHQVRRLAAGVQQTLPPLTGDDGRAPLLSCGRGAIVGRRRLHHCGLSFGLGCRVVARSVLRRQGHDNLTRGSITLYTMSTTRFAPTRKTDAIRTVPMITGRS